MPPRKPKDEARLIAIYPIPGRYIMGVPTKVQQVTEAEWKRISAYTPPAFTRKPPQESAAGESED